MRLSTLIAAAIPFGFFLRQLVGVHDGRLLHADDAARVGLIPRMVGTLPGFFGGFASAVCERSPLIAIVAVWVVLSFGPQAEVALGTRRLVAVVAAAHAAFLLACMCAATVLTTVSHAYYGGQLFASCVPVAAVLAVAAWWHSPDAALWPLDAASDTAVQILGSGGAAGLPKWLRAAARARHVALWLLVLGALVEGGATPPAVEDALAGFATQGRAVLFGGFTAAWVAWLLLRFVLRRPHDAALPAPVGAQAADPVGQPRADFALLSSVPVPAVARLLSPLAAAGFSVARLCCCCVPAATFDAIARVSADADAAERSGAAEAEAAVHHARAAAPAAASAAAAADADADRRRRLALAALTERLERAHAAAGTAAAAAPPA
jgi:hypothetical protein